MRSGWQSKMGGSPVQALDQGLGDLVIVVLGMAAANAGHRKITNCVTQVCRHGHTRSWPGVPESLDLNGVSIRRCIPGRHHALDSNDP